MVIVSPCGTIGRRRGRILFATLVALAFLGGGVFYWLVIPWIVARDSRPSPAPAPNLASSAPKAAPVSSDRINEPGEPIGEEEPAFWSDVAIYQAGPDRDRPIVVMGRGKEPEPDADRRFFRGLLARELVRQGFLMSAREEFGALTRDLAIGDPEVPGEPDATLRIGSCFRTGWGAPPDDPGLGRITIVEGRGANRRVLWTRRFDCEMADSPQYQRLGWLVEGFTRKGFPKALEAKGLKRIRRSETLVEGDALPEEITNRLAQPVETEQFAAIRALHQAIRDGGQTTIRLQALGRAYAQLGTLAEAQWTDDYEAFQARGLLYAQRPMTLLDSSPEALRGRAYVESLMGLLGQSGWDLDEAEKADGGQGSPSWLPWIRAFDADDAPALKAYSQEHPDELWPLYARFLVASRSSGANLQRGVYCRHEIREASEPILEKVPDCYRVFAGLTEIGGVANLHVATSIGLEVYPDSLRDRLSATPDLPASVREVLKDGEEIDEIEVRRRLDAAAADDPSDLSWGVLARQFREIRFFLVAQRVNFIAYTLSASPGGFAAAAMPLVADHRNRSYLAFFAPQAAGLDPREALNRLDFEDLQWKALALAEPFRAVDPARQEELLGRAWTHLAWGTVPGEVGGVFSSPDNPEGRYPAAHNLLKYHPNSPLGRAALIASKWDEAQPSVEDWKKDHGGHDTAVLAELGFHALKTGDDEQAETWLKQALDQSPEGWIFDGLAALYIKRGDYDRYIEAVTQFLQTEDLGLDHAGIAGDLAKALMREDRFEEARPFAEAAAESWANWAMRIAVRCDEEMEDWERAELWASRIAERYSDSWLFWAEWCLRTGHGNTHAAIRQVEAQIEAGRPLSSFEELYAAGVLLLLDDQPGRAREVFQAGFEPRHDLMTGILLALACDRDGDSEARDATLKAIIDTTNPSGPNTVRILAILAPWLRKGGEAPLDLKPIEAMLKGVDPALGSNTHAVIGLLLDGHADDQDAIRFLKRADESHAHPWIRFLARGALRAHEVQLEPIPAP